MKKLFVILSLIAVNSFAANASSWLFDVEIDPNGWGHKFAKNHRVGLCINDKRYRYFKVGINIKTEPFYNFRNRNKIKRVKSIKLITCTYKKRPSNNTSKPDVIHEVFSMDPNERLEVELPKNKTHFGPGTLKIIFFTSPKDLGEKPPIYISTKFISTDWKPLHDDKAIDSSTAKSEEEESEGESEEDEVVDFSPAQSEEESEGESEEDEATDSSATDSSATDSSATDSSATDSSATDSSATDSSATESSATESEEEESEEESEEDEATDSSATDSSATESEEEESEEEEEGEKKPISFQERLQTFGRWIHRKVCPEKKKEE